MKEPDPQRQLACALGRIPSGVYIVTVRQGDVETGMLASWVQQCSFSPPRISLAIQPNRVIAGWLIEGTSFTLNILDADQTDMIAHFGQGFAPGQPAFEGLEVERPEGIAPVLSEALGYLDCRVVSRHSAGDHDLFVSQVVAGRLLGDGQPMVHIRKNGLHY